jgi:hypothetical protein
VCRAIDLNASKPVTPGSVSGAAKVCPGNSGLVYSVAAVTRASQYNWIVPTGMTITSGMNTNIITADVNALYIGGTLTVTASNVCGVSSIRTKPMSLDNPSTPTAITGNANGVCGMSFVTYTIPAVTNADSYIWTVPAGAVINGAATGTGILVSYAANFTSGSITVRAVNGCGTGAARTLTVTGAPLSPGSITGPITVCTGSQHNYSVATVVGAVTYTWTAPGTILSGQGTKDINVQFGSSATAGQAVTVKATNACGTSASRILSGIAVNFCIRNTVEEDMALSVYPNPAQDVMTLTFFSAAAADYTVELFDISGRVVLSDKYHSTEGMNSNEIQLQDVSNGVYTLVVRMDGQQQRIRLIID